MWQSGSLMGMCYEPRRLSRSVGVHRCKSWSRIHCPLWWPRHSQISHSVSPDHNRSYRRKVHGHIRVYQHLVWGIRLRSRICLFGIALRHLWRVVTCQCCEKVCFDVLIWLLLSFSTIFSSSDTPNSPPYCKRPPQNTRRTSLPKSI